MKSILLTKFGETIGSEKFPSSERAQPRAVWTEEGSSDIMNKEIDTWKAECMSSVDTMESEGKVSMFVLKMDDRISLEYHLGYLHS